MAMSTKQAASVTTDFRPPRVSVICIFFNAEQFFAEAIDSVLAQDCDDFELILVDDGSTDSSTELAKDYASREPLRVRYVEHPGHSNRGMGAARNLGLRAARGELVALIDADDRWRTAKLRDQIAFLDEFPNVDAVCGTANYWWSWNGGKDKLQKTGYIQDRPLEPPTCAFELYPFGQAVPPCPSDLMLRRSIIDKVGGFEESFTGGFEDQAFLGKFYLEGTIYCADRNWIDYRVHDNGCGERIRREGRYHERRRFFLEWYLDYLDRSRKPHAAAVRKLVLRALFPYRHPHLSRVVQPFIRVVRKLVA